jgi:RimJ/RimL family protein N-acetyltransferase
MAASSGAGALALRRLTATEARGVLEGDGLPPGLRAGEGWPHRDSYDALRLAAAGSYVWLVTLDDRVIGDCGSLGGVDGQGAIEIGFGLAEPYRRRGHGTALVRHLTAWLLAQPAVRQVVARTDADNVASSRALEQAGFQRSGATGTQLRYSFPRQSPPPGK